MSHTPGPWTAFYKPKYDEWHVSLPMSGSSMRLALAPDGIQSENREGDAHLIAAAPDMLEALKGAVTLAEMLVWPKSMGDEATAALKARLAAIHSAIAKATA